MSKEKYRVGIIGCGNIGGNYAAAFGKLHDRVELVAACDIIEEKAKEFAEGMGNSRMAYTDMGEMFAKEALDIVGVHNPQPRTLSPQRWRQQRLALKGFSAKNRWH